MLPLSLRAARAAALLGAAFALLVLIDPWPILRGPHEWQWGLLGSISGVSLAVASGALLLFVAIWRLGARWLVNVPSRQKTVIALVLLSLAALLVQLSVISLTAQDPFSTLFERLASNQASGYFTVAQGIDHVPTFLREYPSLMPQFAPDPHPRSKPPGIVLLYWGLEQLLNRSPGLASWLGHWGRGVRCVDLWLVARSDAALASNALMGILTPLLSALAIWPAYGLGSRDGKRQQGWLAAGLVGLMPGRLLFTPHLDTIYPLLTLAALYLVDQGLRRDGLRWTAVAGLAIGLATFLSLVNVLAGLLAAAFLLVALARKGSWPAVVRQGGALLGGSALIWLAYWATSGVTILDIYAAAAPARHDLSRNYWLWLMGNPYDFAVFAGLPAFLLALWSIVRYAKSETDEPQSLTAAFWLVFTAVTVSGVIRGEVGRIWLMMAPLPALLTATNVELSPAVRLPGDQKRWRAALTPTLLVTATGFTVLAIGARWSLTILEWPSSSRQPNTTRPNVIPNDLMAQQGPEIELIGYQAAASDVRLDLTLYWHALSRPDVAYTVFIHVLDPVTGEIAAQRDSMPLSGDLPTTCWQPGEYITDAHSLDLSQLEGQTYHLAVGLYDQATAVRLSEPVFLPDIKLER